MTRARTIVLGASHWHVPLYAEAIAAAHDPVGISDDIPEHAAAIAATLGVEVSPRWRDVVDLPGVELAYVFGPHRDMPEKCLALIERGIPFVVEKPLGICLDDVRRVRLAAEAAGVAAAVPLMQRDGPMDRWLARAGRPVYQRYAFIAGPPERYLANHNPWMLDPAVAGGGCLANLGPHFVDLFLQRSGHREVATLSRLSNTLHAGAIEDHASLTLTTSDGREALIEVGYAFPASPAKRSCSYTSVGELGYAEITADGVATFTDLEGTCERAELDVDSDPLYAPFVRKVADSLPHGFGSLPSLGDLEDTMRVIWEAYDAHRGDKPWPA